MTTTTARPLALALALAEEALAAAYAALQKASDGDDAVTADEAHTGADVARDAAFAAWRDSDEERTYSTSDGQGSVDIDCCPSELAQAVEAEWSRCWDFDGESATWWCHVTATCDDGTVEHVRITIEPAEPSCADDGEHDYEHERVVGHGGGVICHEQCNHCGSVRVTDTWAQDAHDGTQGHTRVSYEDAPDGWKLPTQWIAVGSDGTRAVIWAAGSTREECEADLATQDDPGDTGIIEVPASIDASDIAIEGTRWLTVRRGTDSTVYVACAVTGDSTSFEVTD